MLSVRGVGRRFCHTSHASLRGGGIHANPPFVQQVAIQNFQLVSDEASSTGQAQGPSPYEYLCAALGSCTSITVQMYARRKNFPLEGISVNLTHQKIKKENLPNLSEAMKNSKNSFVDRIERVITLQGKELKSEERERMLAIANMCPVHKTLELSCVIVTSLSTSAP
jgi:putative redox protein